MEDNNLRELIEQILWQHKQFKHTEPIAEYLVKNLSLYFFSVRQEAIREFDNAIFLNPHNQMKVYQCTPFAMRDRRREFLRENGMEG